MKYKKKNIIPGAPANQPGPQKQEIMIPANIDEDVDNMIEALIKMKRTWKILTSKIGEMDAQLKKKK